MQLIISQKKCSEINLFYVKFYRKTPFLVAGATYVFFSFFSMVAPGTIYSRKFFGGFSIKLKPFLVEIELWIR